MAEKWDVFRQIGERHKADVLIVIDRDIVDYFTDIAKATDDREMGGFLLGDYVYYSGSPKPWLIAHFHDYVQVPNVSEKPETTFAFPEESLREVADMISAGRYSAFTLLHTHPSDSFFSVEDLHVHYRFRLLISDVVPEEARRFQHFIPHFTITGGEVGYAVSYMDYLHWVCYYYDESAYLVVSSKSVDSNPELRRHLFWMARVKFPDDFEFHLGVTDYHYTVAKISDLEEIFIRGGETEDVERIIEEIKERMRREIERRLRQL